MRTRKLIALGTASLTALALTALPASAEDTVATFEITATTGSLAVDAPDGDATTPLDLGTVDLGSPAFAPQMGTVTVTDTRGALVADWTTTATATHFDLQDANADPENDVNQRVLNTAINYAATPTVEVGTGVVTATAGNLDVGATVAYAGSGSNTVTWDPTLTFTLLLTQVVGTYQGTITHSTS